jgi:hypothetical protein
MMAIAAAITGGVLLASAAVQCAALAFEMLYLTDELLYYALKHEGFVGDFALKLANLMYSVALKHQVRITVITLSIVRSILCIYSCLNY